MNITRTNDKCLIELSEDEAEVLSVILSNVELNDCPKEFNDLCEGLKKAKTLKFIDVFNKYKIIGTLKVWKK